MKGKGGSRKANYNAKMIMMAKTRWCAKVRFPT